jgi:hypothetical protein
VEVAEQVSVVDAAEVEVAEAVAADVDKQPFLQGKPMNTRLRFTSSSKIYLIASAILASALFLGLSSHAASETGSRKQKEFSSSKEAADTLLRAAEAFDVAALEEILGPDATDLIKSADPVADKKRAIDFAAKSKEKMSLDIDPKNSKRTILSVGNDAFPLAIPIVQRKGKWILDTKAGRDELLMRRIGANELDAIEICRGFVEAQQEYAQQKHDDSPVNQYAQTIISTPGKHDGLAWQNADGTWAGPVGESVAKAIAQGYSDKRQPYHGYYFKVLKGQGPAAPLGQMDFVVKGAMIGGFALAAAPAQYRVTGVKTFIVGPDGVVYEKDLGADTLKMFASMDRFNPDKTWKATDDEWPAQAVVTE